MPEFDSGLQARGGCWKVQAFAVGWTTSYRGAIDDRVCLSAISGQGRRNPGILRILLGRAQVTPRARVVLAGSRCLDIK